MPCASCLVLRRGVPATTKAATAETVQYALQMQSATFCLFNDFITNSYTLIESENLKALGPFINVPGCWPSQLGTIVLYLYKTTLIQWDCLCKINLMLRSTTSGNAGSSYHNVRMHLDDRRSHTLT